MFTKPDLRSRLANPSTMRATAMLDRTMSAMTSDDKRRMAPRRRIRTFGGCNVVNAQPPMSAIAPPTRTWPNENA